MALIPFFLLFSPVFATAFKQVQLSNSQARRDTQGVIMDVHDGSLISHPFQSHHFLYYGASYGTCKRPMGDDGCADARPSACGFQLNHNVSLFESHDLLHWNHTGAIFWMHEHPVPGILYCPKVVYNRHTQRFVLWYNWLPVTTSDTFAESYFGVATSPNASGPYTIHTTRLRTLVYSHLGDFDLFVDATQNDAAYVIYTSNIKPVSVWTYWPIIVVLIVCLLAFGLKSHPWIRLCLALVIVLLGILLWWQLNRATHLISVEQLTDDYLASKGKQFNSGFIGPGGTEAPTLFEREGVYYALLGQTCCFCGQGGPVTYYTARHPLGPYQTGSLVSTLSAQQTQVSKLSSTVYLWRANRWQSDPDLIKARDFSYFHPLTFESQRILPLSFQTDVNITLA